MKKVLIVYLFTIILSISCNNPDITSDKIISNTQKEENLSLRKARLKNNMAYFESFESLADSLRALQNQDLKYLLSKQKANNFNSLYGYYLGSAEKGKKYL